MKITDSHLIDSTDAGRIRRSLYSGMQSRVARDLGINASFVSMVMSGKKTSARVSKAITAEITRIERKVTRDAKRKAVAA